MSELCDDRCRLSAARQASLFEEMERDLGFSGAVLISQKRQTVFEGAYGFASRQLNVPNTVETRFHIASLTKMFIAMAALTLVEDGRIALDQRPAKDAPSLSSLDDRITLHHLLSHTSGFSDVYDDTPNPDFETLGARTPVTSMCSPTSPLVTVPSADTRS